MATHSSVLAWRIPGTGEPGGLPSMGSHRVRTRLKRLNIAYTCIYTYVYIYTSYCNFGDLKKVEMRDQLLMGL